MKMLLTIGAVAAATLTASAADARMVCTQWHHGRCVAMARVNRGQMIRDRNMARREARREARRAALYRVGYHFTPTYHYTTYSALPQTYVSQYSLSPDYRYVYRDNYIYVVDPKTYAVQRVIDALTH